MCAVSLLVKKLCSMDSRLRRVGGARLTHIRYSDVPRVAQAIIDGMAGRARVLSGRSYVEFVRDQAYTVVVRADDWRKIFPFLRYSSASYRPVIPPDNQPAPIMSPQPNRTMQPPPENPAGGLKSFLEFPFDEYSKIQKLLTTIALTRADRPRSGSFNSYPEPVCFEPPQQRTDFSYTDTQLYNKLVHVLQELFPTDFPTTNL